MSQDPFLTMACKLPIALMELVERAFVCDPVKTEYELAWLTRYWKVDFGSLNLRLRVDRSLKTLVCLEDCDMSMLDSINARLAERVRIQRLKEAQAKASAPKPSVPAELVAVLACEEEYGRGDPAPEAPSAPAEPRYALHDLPPKAAVVFNARDTSNDAAEQELQSVEQVEDTITRALEGKTVGVKLLEEERKAIKTLMLKHNIGTFKEGVLLCITKGIEAWSKE